MGESNLRTREKLLPSEKGFTYKAMMEALRKQPGIRLGEGLRDRTREILAKHCLHYAYIFSPFPEILFLLAVSRLHDVS